MKMQTREFMGDYALDLDYPGEKIVIFFNSYQNALNVKRIIEVDGSVPNVATVADFVEVVRCRNCKFATELDKHCELNRAIYKHCSLMRGEPTNCVWHKYKKYYKNYSLVEADDYCSYGERKDGDEK